MMKPYVIGICGGSGSGKSTVVSKLLEKFAPDVMAIPHDNYYRDLSHLTEKERSGVNFDHPMALETELLVEHLKKLKKGEKIEGPDYDFVTHLRRENAVSVDAKRVILVEGILVFENKDLRDQFDLKVFVDTEADLRFIRRVERDMKERGRSFDSVVKQYLTTVKPMHDEFVEPSKKWADIIIPEGGFNVPALGMLLARVREILDDGGNQI